MTLEEFQTDLEAKLAALSDDELRAELESVGCVFADPWLEAVLDADEVVSVSGTTQPFAMSANSNELALAA